ncbi:hypothetical protein HanIR_Chr01g0013831 [Helianthus annuus]|nr:hypothetical protein HanIR_Chr01g0013831 [Helianthus annuus]
MNHKSKLLGFTIKELQRLQLIPPRFTSGGPKTFFFILPMLMIVAPALSCWLWVITGVINGAASHHYSFFFILPMLQTE